MKTYIYIVGLVLLLTIALSVYIVNQNKRIEAIESFEDCVTAGFPVMESYPERCAIPNGRSFTRSLTETECKAMSPDTCLGSCVVCPPCPECSSISCQTEEFCKTLGIDRDWYQKTRYPQEKQRDTSSLANPASEYCKEQGGSIEIRTASDGSQTGVCIFFDGKECEEWQFFRNECDLFK